MLLVVPSVPLSVERCQGRVLSNDLRLLVLAFQVSDLLVNDLVDLVLLLDVDIRGLVLSLRPLFLFLAALAGFVEHGHRLQIVAAVDDLALEESVLRPIVVGCSVLSLCLLRVSEGCVLVAPTFRGNSR